MKMTKVKVKVHPNANTTTRTTASVSVSDQPPKPSTDGGSSVVLTVWKKSLLLNCDGFTVFDSKGNLVFRVDNYISGSKGEIILMDASGNSLLTIRRKRLIGLSDHWAVFERDHDDSSSTASKPPRDLFSVKKRILMNLVNSKSLAQVTNSGKKEVMYEIEGCYRKRCCGVYDDRKRLVAKIKRKEAMGGKVSLGLDVFHLVVYDDEPPYMDSATAMALVILLDQMFQPSTRNRSFTFV